MKIWNKKPLSPDQLHTERKLLPRLKLMSYLFFALSLASLLFVLFVESTNPPTPTDDFLTLTPLGDEATDQLDLGPLEVLNFYLISFLFAALGATCLYITKTKRQTLFDEEEPQ